MGRWWHGRLGVVARHICHVLHGTSRTYCIFYSPPYPPSYSRQLTICPMVYRSSCFLHLSASLHNPPHATGQVSTNHSSQFALPPNQPPLSTPALPRETHCPLPTAHHPPSHHPHPTLPISSLTSAHYTSIPPSLSLFLPSLLPQKTPPNKHLYNPSLPRTSILCVHCFHPSCIVASA